MFNRIAVTFMRKRNTTHVAEVSERPRHRTQQCFDSSMTTLGSYSSMSVSPAGVSMDTHASMGRTMPGKDDYGFEINSKRKVQLTRFYCAEIKSRYESFRHAVLWKTQSFRGVEVLAPLTQRYIQNAHYYRTCFVLRK